MSPSIITPLRPQCKRDAKFTKLGCTSETNLNSSHSEDTAMPLSLSFSFFTLYSSVSFNLPKPHRRKLPHGLSHRHVRFDSHRLLLRYDREREMYRQVCVNSDVCLPEFVRSQLLGNEREEASPSVPTTVVVVWVAASASAAFFSPISRSFYPGFSLLIFKRGLTSLCGTKIQRVEPIYC